MTHRYFWARQVGCGEIGNRWNEKLEITHTMTFLYFKKLRPQTTLFLDKYDTLGLLTDLNLKLYIYLFMYRFLTVVTSFLDLDLDLERF